LGGNAFEVVLRNVVGERGSLECRLLGYTGHLSMGGRLFAQPDFPKVCPISALLAVLLWGRHLSGFIFARLVT
jgi:hypothetical protein